MKRFTKVNEAFVCENCGKKVLPTSKGTYRDHCPFCLFSKHVDLNPGDRANKCGGLLEPLDVEKGKKDTMILVFKCQKCGEHKKNKMAIKTKIQPDNVNLALEIARNKPWI